MEHVSEFNIYLVIYSDDIIYLGIGATLFLFWHKFPKKKSITSEWNTFFKMLFREIRSMKC